MNRYLFAASSCVKPRRLWYMPTEEQMEQHGMTDLVHAIKIYHGGFASVARRFGMRIQGPATRSKISCGLTSLISESVEDNVLLLEEEAD
mmetsp:Transcript_41255/g.129613  ORF Transcript_41255/g.129613 Transcript_41255/m.129613 type:complete len:90 (+) Transcript_41255:473-742(+)